MEINTLFKPKDTIFFLHENVVIEKTVSSITINVYDTHYAINYDVEMSKPGQSTNKLKIPEILAFPSVQQLAQSLVQNHNK